MRISFLKRIMKFIQLCGSDKLQMPIVGLGTWRAQPQEVENAVNAALNVGYRHIGKHCFMHSANTHLFTS